MSGALLQYGSLACVLPPVSILPFVPWARRLPRPWRVAAALILAIVCLVEVQGASVAGFLRGAIGDPAVTTTLFLLARLYAWISDHPLLDDGDRRAVFTGVAVAGVFLYPMALGLGHFDPYGLGYNSWLPALAVAALVVLAIVRRQPHVAWLLVITMLACGLSLLESDNLWNYFLDPLIVFYSLAWVLQRAIGRWKEDRSGV